MSTRCPTASGRAVNATDQVIGPVDGGSDGWPDFETGTRLVVKSRTEVSRICAKSSFSDAAQVKTLSKARATRG
jgi:hypothetical protein